MTKRKPVYSLNILTDKVDKDLENRMHATLRYFTCRYSLKDFLDVYICDEATLGDAYCQYYSSTPMPPLEDIYSHRGFCNPGNQKIVIYYTKYENPTSVMWILHHELCHYQISRSYAIKHWIHSRNMQANEKYDHMELNYHNDLVHEADLEERICNDYATYSTKEKCYDRIWWNYQKSSQSKAQENEGTHDNCTRGSEAVRANETNTGCNPSSKCTEVSDRPDNDDMQEGGNTSGHSD